MFDNENLISKQLLEKLKRMQNAIDDAQDEQENSSLKDKALEQGFSA
ncbi:hypothetical protein OLP40_02085 [Campylobacter jejuni]|nr:hypothetical protein C414_000010120 [Campylobacter jejuni subsp. jejuni 414]MCW1333178.1 hypothetical protein [Campylobacter jejuni]MCW1358619.1 hypothetical protein [Campylobacter jejuni]HDZ4936710.1 hypothetical protein [Campylobacter jejuni]HDZ4940362.1 hypothetical protein [Campylobacter jejuni]